jgi:hypothetical protein
LKLKLKLLTTCAGKLDRLLSLGPLYQGQVLYQNAFCLDGDYGGYGGIGKSLLEGSTHQVFVHGTPDTAPKLVEVIRAKVPDVTGTSDLGAPLAMDFSMADGPPASHINESYIHSWLQDTVEAHKLLLDKIVCFAILDFGWTHHAFRLMITCAVRRYGFFAPHHPP